MHAIEREREREEKKEGERGERGRDERVVNGLYIYQSWTVITR